MNYCYLELLGHNLPQVLNIRRDVAHGTVHTGYVTGIDLFVSGAEVNPRILC